MNRWLATGIGKGRYFGFRWWRIGPLVIGRVFPEGQYELSWRWR